MVKTKTSQSLKTQLDHKKSTPQRKNNRQSTALFDKLNTVLSGIEVKAPCIPGVIKTWRPQRRKVPVEDMLHLAPFRIILAVSIAPQPFWPWRITSTGGPAMNVRERYVVLVICGMVLGGIVAPRAARADELAAAVFR